MLPHRRQTVGEVSLGTGQTAAPDSSQCTCNPQTPNIYSATVPSPTVSYSKQHTLKNWEVSPPPKTKSENTHTHMHTHTHTTKHKTHQPSFTVKTRPFRLPASPHTCARADLERPSAAPGTSVSKGRPGPSRWEGRTSRSPEEVYVPKGSEVVVVSRFPDFPTQPGIFSNIFSSRSTETPGSAAQTRRDEDEQPRGRFSSLAS